MIELRRAEDRGRARFDWLDSRHTFSFGDYYDPRHMGFGPLRVLNDDRVTPGAGFAEHGHANMEIVSYVLEGALAHRDSLGNGSVMRPGDVQRMSAGSGIRHSEFNASKTAPVRFLQIWLQPDVLNVTPGYAQSRFSEATRRACLRLVVSPDGADRSLPIRQNARIYSGLFAAGERAQLSLDSGRRAWVQVARGSLSLNGETLTEGDGAAVRGEASLSIEGYAPPATAAHGLSEVLVLDLP